VSNRWEDEMDLWAALGITPQAGLIAVAAGIAAAFAVAATLARRRSREPKRSLDLGMR